MQSLWVFDWDTFYLEVGGMMAGFFGIASVVISVLEPVLSNRPFDPWLFVFGGGCLFASWVALEITVWRKAGR